MLPAPFEYHAPETTDDTLALLDQLGDEGKVLAGGQSLIPMLKLRFASPSHLVDVNRVQGLDFIDERDGTQEEIALATLAEIAAERHAVQRRDAVWLPETAIDPICGMRVEVKGAMHTLRLGETIHYFCGAGCLDAFRLREGQSISR
jgi:YHS domain-containing protein